MPRRILVSLVNKGLTHEFASGAGKKLIIGKSFWLGAQKKPLRSPGAVFENSNGNRLLDLGENNGQREQRQGFNKHQSQNHRRADLAAGSRIARHAFAGGRGHTALSQRTAERSEGHTQARGESSKSLPRRSRARFLSEGGRRHQQYGGKHTQPQNCFLHYCLLGMPPVGGSRPSALQPVSRCTAKAKTSALRLRPAPDKSRAAR